MRIEEFHVDGFGRFQNLSVTALGPGLSIVLGKNEAGKSTMLAFLRAVLFGLPPKKQAEFYPPLNGGRHGGRIVLVDGEANRIQLERYAGKRTGKFTATFPDGSQLGEEQFRQRLGMITGDVYEKVFAFGLGELQTFDTLRDENIRDAIYNASVGTGMQSPAQVVRKLNERAELLFKPGGTNPEINQVLKRLMQRQQQIGAHAADQDEYQRIQDELTRVERDCEETSSELHRCRQRLARLRVLQQARDDWVLLTGAREQLQSLPQVESFPQEGVSRLESLLRELRSMRDRMLEVSSEKQEEEEKLASIQVEATLLSLTGEIRGLERRVDLFEQNRRQLAGVQTDRSLADEQLKQSLRDLGDEWTEDKLRNFDLSIPAREEFTAAREECEEARARLDKQAAEVELREKQLRECREFERAERTTLAQLAGPTADLNADVIRRLGRHQTAYEAARRDLPRVAQECKGNEQRLHATLRSINPDWTEERLDRFDDSLAAREALNVHRERLDKLRSRSSQLESRIDDAGRSVREHQDAVERDEGGLASLPEVKADEASLLERKNRLRGLRSLLTQHGQLQSELTHQNEWKQGLAEQLSLIEREIKATPAGIPHWLTPGIALLGLIGLLVLGLFRNEWVMGTIVFVITLSISVMLYAFQRRATSVAPAERDRRTRDREQISRRIAELQSSFQEFRERERALRERIHDLAQSADVDLPLSDSPNEMHAATGSVDEQEEQIERQLSLLQRRHPIEQRLADRRTQWDCARDAAESARHEREELEDQLRQAESDWRSWLTDVGLPETLSPEVATNVLSRLDAARELLRTVNDQRRRVREMEQEINGFEESVRAVVAGSEIDDAPSDTIAALQLLTDRLAEHEDRLRGIHDGRRRVKEAEQRTAQAAEILNESNRLHKVDLESQSSADHRWVELLRRRGLRETLTGTNADPMIQGIERARGELARRDNHHAAEQSLTQQTTAFVEDVDRVVQNVGLSLRNPNDVSTLVETLGSRLRQAEEAHRRREQLRESIQKSDDRQNQLEMQISERQRELQILLDAAGTTDEETFRQLASDYDKLQSLSENVRVLETRLRQLAESPDKLPDLEREIEQSPPQVLQAEQEELEEALNVLENKKEQTVRLSENLRRQGQQLENSDELSSLRIQQESDLAEFCERAREWSILKIAAHLIDRAREKYERERRPAVLKQAEQYFTRLTHGGYREILTTEGDPQIVAPNGTRKELRHLSRGTSEQLYLSLRFGFVEEFTRRSEPLPLVFDDILVNFDADRAAAAAEAIVELSRRHQILLFTCHPATVQVLQSIDSEVHVFTLHDGQLKDARILSD